jgi:hypothetical protein
MAKLVAHRRFPNAPKKGILPCILHKYSQNIFVNNQLEEQFFFMCVYFYSLHVSDSHVSITRRINCINTTFGVCHSV